MADLPPPKDKHSPEKPPDRVLAQSVQWSGPLPPPASLEHFDRVIPGGAERILRMSEIEQGHRVQTEQAAITASIKDAKLGKYLGAGITTLAILAAIAVVLLKGPWQVAVAFVGVPVLAAVQALIRGRHDDE